MAEEKKKICPILSFRTDCLEECREELCALWNKGNKMCSIKLIECSLDLIAQEGISIIPGQP